MHYTRAQRFATPYPFGRKRANRDSRGRLREFRGRVTDDISGFQIPADEVVRNNGVLVSGRPQDNTLDLPNRPGWPGPYV